MRLIPLGALPERSLLAFRRRGVPGLGSYDACRTRASTFAWGWHKRALNSRKPHACVEVTCLITKAARAGPRKAACFVIKFSKKNIYQTLSQQLSCVSASFWLASVHMHFPLPLQAVETNLASKDSHWVFVNEVRAQTGEGWELHWAPCPLGKLKVILSGLVLTMGARVKSRAPLCQDQRSESWPWPAKMLTWSMWEPGKESKPESTREVIILCVHIRHLMWGVRGGSQSGIRGWENRVV